MSLSIQDIALELVFNKGISDNEAIAELSKTNKLTALTIRSIRDTLDRWRHFHPVKTKDGTEKCYFCEIKVSEAQYCYGCEWWVCSSCDTEHPTGKHNVKDHYKLPIEKEEG